MPRNVHGLASQLDASNGLDDTHKGVAVDCTAEGLEQGRDRARVGCLLEVAGLLKVVQVVGLGHEALQYKFALDALEEAIVKHVFERACRKRRMVHRHGIAHVRLHAPTLPAEQS